MNQEEIRKEAARLIAQIEAPEKGLGKELFESLITIMPQPCVEAMVVDSLERSTKIYLVWRQDQHYKGWHCPGTFLRFGEDFPDAIRRVLLREINVGLGEFRPTNVQYSKVDSRGQTIGTVWLIQLDGEPTGGEWFPITQLPEPTLPHHREFILKVFR